MEDYLWLNAGLRETLETERSRDRRAVHDRPIVNVVPHRRCDPQIVPHGPVHESDFTSDGALALCLSQMPNLGHDRVGLHQIKILVAS